MIVKRIRALIDIDLHTFVESRFLFEGETASVSFKNEGEFENLLEFGHFEEVRSGESDHNVPDIPVIRDEDIPEEDLTNGV